MRSRSSPEAHLSLNDLALHSFLIVAIQCQDVFLHLLWIAHIPLIYSEMVMSEKSTWSKTWISNISIRWQKEKLYPVHMGFEAWLWVDWRNQHSSDKNSEEKRRENWKSNKCFYDWKFSVWLHLFSSYICIFGVEALRFGVGWRNHQHSIVMFVDFIPQTKYTYKNLLYDLINLGGYWICMKCIRSMKYGKFHLRH